MTPSQTITNNHKQSHVHISKFKIIKRTQTRNIYAAKHARCLELASGMLVLELSKMLQSCCESTCRRNASAERLTDTQKIYTMFKYTIREAAQQCSMPARCILTSSTNPQGSSQFFPKGAPKYYCLRK